MALYKRGDLVWAKMKGFPPWPGIITAPPAELKKQPSKKSTLYHCIFLFGTEKYSWIETHKLDRYNKGSGNTGRKRSAALREAVVAIEAYIDNGEAAPNFNITPEGDVFDKLVSESKSTHSRHQQHLSPPKSKSKKTGDDSDMHTISSGIESVKELTSIRQEMALKVDNIINLTESSSLSGDTSKHSVSPPDFKSPNQNKSSTSATNLSTKKKQVQQIFRARPFRQLAKPRALERKSGSNEWDIRSSTTPSPMDSSSKKRSSATTRSQESSPSEAKKKKLQLHSDTDATTPMFHPHAHSYARRGPAAHLADRPPNIARPETPPLDLLSVSQIFLNKHITPSPLLFGFLGLGIMGSRMVKNLLNSGHRVIVWNHSPEKSREFAKVGAEIGATPQDVCSAADITFSCVSGPKAAKDMVFGNCGALREMNSTKAYVEMTNIDKETSLDIAAAITSRGARYLEAQIQGSKAEADKATLVILAAGDLSLYNDCQSCFEAFGRSSFFLGEVGNASKMNLVIQMIAGITVAGLAEGLALADRCGLKQFDILEVISMTSLGCPMILDKGKCITECSFPTSLALSHMQKDLKLGLKLGDELKQPLPMTTIANEVYKHSKQLGYGDHDASAVYMGSRYSRI